MMPLTNNEHESYASQENFRTCKKQFEDKYVDSKIHCKIRDHCHYTVKYKGAPHSIYNLKYSIPNEVLNVLHIKSNYDYCLS